MLTFLLTPIHWFGRIIVSFVKKKLLFIVFVSAFFSHQDLEQHTTTTNIIINVLSSIMESANK